MSAGGGRRSKVARVLEEYDLADEGETLERYWTREEDRYSLRELADHLNVALLRSEHDGLDPVAPDDAL